MSTITPVTPVTFESLRARGFRLHIPFGNYEPHMRLSVDPQHDSHLEVGKCGMMENEWSAWIVSEMACRYGKFCYLRSFTTIEQLDLLYVGLTGKPMPSEEVDADQFAEALARTRELVLKHWKEVYTADHVRNHILMPR